MTYHGVASIAIEFWVGHESSIVEGLVEDTQDEGWNARHGEVEEDLRQLVDVGTPRETVEKLEPKQRENVDLGKTDWVSSECRNNRLL